MQERKEIKVDCSNLIYAYFYCFRVFALVLKFLGFLRPAVACSVEVEYISYWNNPVFVNAVPKFQT